MVCHWIVVAGLLLSSREAAAQGTPQGVVSGRVVERETGSPVAAALVRVTAQDSRESTSGTTDASGRFSVPLPTGNGPFSLRAERIGYVPLTVVITSEEAAGGAVWRDLRLSAQPVAIAGVEGRDRRPEPESVSGWTPGGSEATTLSWSSMAAPLEPGDLAGLAALQPGVHGSGGGLSIFGQDPSQTRTTLDGASFGATTLPQEALAAATVVTGAYDVSRGQYSGGMIEARTLGGTNRFGAALRGRFSHPGLQWATSPEALRPPEGTFAHAQGGAGGALVWNRLYWYSAFSATRRSTPLVSLESATPGMLASLGAHPDSVARLAALVREAGIGGAAPSSRANADLASLLARFDFEISPTHSMMLRLDGRHLALGGVGIAPLSTVGSGGTLRERSAGVQVQVASRFERLENDLRVRAAGESRRTVPEWSGPAGSVRVASGPEDRPAGSSVLRFGGGGFASDAGGTLLELSDEVRIRLGAHELKVGMFASEERADLESAGNAYGSFSFNSLADLQAGRPALFTRTLGEQGAEAATRYGALYLGDVWRRGRLAVTLGARLEGRSYPRSGPELETPFGAPGRVPSEWGVSPRLGWSYDGGRWSLRGGLGEFRGTVSVPALAAVIGDGSGIGAVSLSCVGPAAPAPAWDVYADDPQAVPTECADGSPGFATRAPGLTLFSDGFAAPRVWRGSLGGGVQVSGALALHGEGTLTRGMSQPVALDRNLVGEPAFVLAAEGGRPVYAAPAAIDPETGGSAPGASRRFPAWEIAREISGRGRSAVAQGTVGFTLSIPGRLILGGAYTFARARDDVGALSAPGGSLPLATDAARLVRAASDRERRHDLQLRAMLTPRPWLRIGVLGRLTSGTPFTPVVDGDVNGDGAYNDPAYVFDPALADDPALASGVAALLQDPEAGACLRRQLGRLARRNSCRTPWSSSIDVRVDIQPWRKALERRLQISVTTQNSLALADRLLHGADGVRGWGEPPVLDPVLLRVRGFDPVRQAFRYEVNPRFGSRDRRGGTLLRPFSLTLEARVALGADPAYQPLEKLITRAMGPGRSPEEIRHELSRKIPNLAAQVVALDSALRLELTAEQRSRLANESLRSSAALAPLADSVALALSAVETHRRQRSRAAWREIEGYLQQIQQELDAGLRLIRDTLTPEQWRKLPESVRVPSRQLLPAPEGGGAVEIG